MSRYLFITILTLCGMLNSLSAWSADQAAATVRFRDAFGNPVQVAAPARRIVVINGDAVEILCAIGARDNIVGISSHTAKNPGPVGKMSDKTVVGPSTGPSIEKIIECRPDLVIAYEMWMSQKAFEAKLIPLGIPVARLFCYRIDHLDEEIRILGRLVGRQDQAEAYIAYKNRIIDTVKQKTGNLKPKIRVYNESYAPYKTVSDGCGADLLLDIAGLDNIAAGQSIPWPEATSEWLVEQNPDLIIKVASATFIKNGYGVDDVQAMDAFRNALITRPAWNRIKAVKSGRVHILASELWVGPRAPIGILYMAKWAYPEHFADMDPEAIHRQWLKKWHGRELKGIYVYP
ncbi:periplasmic binding protein [Desulfosarcina variabilis str. Montpellier]|uniref:ABC transporter substrate-binding protein n=1 Tax=Desulfosarcina variabilis TaxID=2300 RepID=UPI003AFA1C7B